MRKALLSVLCIALVAMTAGAGTFAYFSDTEVSTGNTFAAGTMDMKIRDFADGETWTDGVTKTWTLSSMKPGDTVFGAVELKNDGTILADHLEITCDYAITETPDIESDTNWSNTPDDLAKQMNISVMKYYDGTGINLLDKLDDYDKDGYKTLYDLKHAGIDGITPPPGIAKKQVDIKLEFLDHLKNNDFQGDTLTVTFIFTLNQHSSQ